MQSDWLDTRRGRLGKWVMEVEVGRSAGSHGGETKRVQLIKTAEFTQLGCLNFPTHSQHTILFTAEICGKQSKHFITHRKMTPSQTIRKNYTCWLLVKHWNLSSAALIALLWSHGRTVCTQYSNSPPSKPPGVLQFGWSYDSGVILIDSSLLSGCSSCAEQTSVSNTGEYTHRYWVSKPGHTHTCCNIQTQKHWDVHFLVPLTTRIHVTVVYCYCITTSSF